MKVLCFKLLLVFLIPLACLNAQNMDIKKYEFFKGNKTEIKNPFKLRDPFKIMVSLKKKSTRGRVRNSDGSLSFSNIEDIANFSLDELEIVGILMGKNRRAIAKIKGDTKSSYVLKEGMIIGEDDLILKAILPGGIVLVEKIRNVYDQDEYLETIIPVSEEPIISEEN